MHATGVLLGAASFLIIGLFHPVVIKAEYYFGARVWPFFLAAGLAAVVGSLFVPAALWSGLLAIFGFSCLWSIRELFEQEERVRKGWFPRNPARPED
jgi:hypothetical protein